MRIGMGLLILDGMLVRRDGIHVPVQLTYATLAELIAARRPTVTKALGELADRFAVGGHKVNAVAQRVDDPVAGRRPLRRRIEDPVGSVRRIEISEDYCLGGSRTGFD